MKPVEFDASIDLCGDAPRTAVEKVRLAVEALPGAHWISVEHCGSPPGMAGDMADKPPEKWIRVWEWGSSAPVAGAEWDGLRSLVKGLVLQVLGV